MPVDAPSSDSLVVGFGLTSYWEPPGGAPKVFLVGADAFYYAANPVAPATAALNFLYPVYAFYFLFSISTNIYSS